MVHHLILSGYLINPSWLYGDGKAQIASLKVSLAEIHT